MELRGEAHLERRHALGDLHDARRAQRMHAFGHRAAPQRVDRLLPRGLPRGKQAREQRNDRRQLAQQARHERLGIIVQGGLYNALVRAMPLVFVLLFQNPPQVLFLTFFVYALSGPLGYIFRRAPHEAKEHPEKHPHGRV